MNLWEQHKAERRERILVAARKLITQGGVEALSMRQLAREAQLSVATLYNLYGSKADILYALLDQGMEAFDQSLKHIPTDDPITFANYCVDVATGLFISEKPFYRPLMAAINEHRDKERDPIIGKHAMTDIIKGLDTGAAHGLFNGHSQVRLVGRQIYLALMQAVHFWSEEMYDDEQLREQCEYSILIALMGVVSESVRPAMIARVEELSQRLDHAFPFSAQADQDSLHAKAGG
jgi:AcrR family transcriptional regulator